MLYMYNSVVYSTLSVYNIYFLRAEAQQLEDKMADLSLASKVQHNIHVQHACAIDH